MPPVTLYLARHAAPDLTPQPGIVYHLPPGPPLSETGAYEALALGNYFKQTGVRHLYASPLKRCQLTAQAVAAATGLPFQTLPGLAEWRPDEEPGEVVSRISPIFEMGCRDSQDGGPAVLITHGGPIRLLLAELGMPAEEIERRLVFDFKNLIPTAGAYRLTRPAPDQPWEMELVFKP
jgi:broad specificity phosphatase PhoE